ncbi:lysoplasmalogenase family protein [Micrococcus lylae]|uniref:lysoplasmalogenase family protein n=1 Tax=Micrococcus lylae TaxID=1273 RepID=UPI003EBAE055
MVQPSPSAGVAATIGAGAAGRSTPRAGRWFYTPPLIVVLALHGCLKHRSGWLWALGLAFSAVGGIAAQSEDAFLLLLCSFLVAHLFSVTALWPHRRRSWLGMRRSLLHVGLAAAGLTLVVPRAGPVMVGPVVAYATVLGLMALLATAAGRSGLFGGLLFIVSDSVLAAGQFGIRIPEPLRTAAVIGTYAPAQVLLTAGWWRLSGGGAEPAVPGTAGSLPAAPAGRTGAAA